MTPQSLHQAFERELWKDAVTLCQVRGTCVEYTVWDEDDNDFKLLEAASKCQIYLIQRQEQLGNDEVRYDTSIWALSDDGAARLQQKLADDEAVVPYTCWGVTSKVTIHVNSTLHFHDVVYQTKPMQTLETSWVTYAFESDAGAATFQSALMGKTLLLSVQTTKTLRLHRGFTGQFAFQEQMCALENLRIWHDPETNGVMAMMHYTPQFRDGYMAFWMNSRRNRIRIVDEGGRFIRIKGLSIEVEGRAGRSRARKNSNVSSSSFQSETSYQSAASSLSAMSSQSAASTVSTTRTIKPQKVKGARIEFTTMQDKHMFLIKLWEAQQYFYAG